MGLQSLQAFEVTGPDKRNVSNINICIRIHRQPIVAGAPDFLNVSTAQQCLHASAIMQRSANQTFSETSTR